MKSHFAFLFILLEIFLGMIFSDIIVVDSWSTRITAAEFKVYFALHTLLVDKANKYEREESVLYARARFKLTVSARR